MLLERGVAFATTVHTDIPEELAGYVDEFVL